MRSDEQKHAGKRFNFNRREYATALMIIVILVISAIYKPEIFSGDRLNNLVHSILMWIPLIVTVALGMMMVICTGEVDVSVGSIVGISGMVIGYMFRDMQISFLVGIIIALAVGTIAGAFNGVLVSYLGAPSLIITLATMNIWRGIALVIGGGVQVDGFYLPEGMGFIVREGPIPGLDIPWLVWIALLFVVIMVFVLKNTHFGREIYAVGGNQNAARLRGINVKKVKFLTFTFTGFFAGIAAIMYGARYGYYNPSNTGNGFEFVVISATVIGGVSMSGGTGTIVGVLLGSLLLGTIQTMIATLGFSGFWSKAMYGLIIVIALLVDKLVQARQMKSSIVQKGVRV